MQDVRRKRCRRKAEGHDNSDGCSKAASYGFVGRTAEMCARHASPGMVNLRHKTCAHVNCFTRPSRGSPISMTAEFCSKHAPSGSISIFSKERKKCARPGCSQKPSFGVKGCNRKTFCSLHATDEMVNIVASENGTEATCTKRTTTFAEKNGSGNNNPESCVDNNLNAGELRSVARHTNRNNSTENAVVSHDGGNNEFTSDVIPAADLATIRGGGKRKRTCVFPSVTVQEEAGRSAKRNRLRFEHPILEPPPSPTLQQPQRRHYHQQYSSPAGHRWAPSIADKPVRAPAPPSSPLLDLLGEAKAENSIRTANFPRVSPHDLEATTCGNDRVRILHGRPVFVAAPMSGHYGCESGWFENRRGEGIVIANMEERGIHDVRSLMTGGFDTATHDPYEGYNASRRTADRVGPNSRGGWRPVYGSDGRGADRWGGNDSYWENHAFGAEERGLGQKGECYPFETFEEFKARRSVAGGRGESGSAVIRRGAPGQTYGVGGAFKADVTYRIGFLQKGSWCCRC